MHSYTQKYIAKMKKQFPDVRICTHKTCEWDDRNHEAVYEYEQHNEDMKRTGTIRIMYTMGFKNKEWAPWNDVKHFEWWNGKDWITL